jgi:hypothetical protein
MSFNFTPPKWALNHLEEVNASLKKYGLHHTTRKYAPKLKLKPEIIYEDESVKNILAKSPNLVVTNHPHDAEPLVLYAALPERDDSFLIANVELLAIFPEANKYLLPVYIKHRIRKEKRTWQPLVQFVDRCYPQTHLPVKEAHQKNIIAIKTAADKINQGHQSVIFPENQLGTWQPGVGHIISNLDMKNNPFLIMAYVKGTTSYDYFRPISLLHFIFPNTKIYFSKAISLKEYKDADPKATTQKLEEIYKNWVQGL